MRHSNHKLDTQPPKRWKRLALEYAQSATYWSGLHAVFSRSTDETATVLMYHSVPAASAAPWIDPTYSLPPSIFERQMRFLAARRNVISLSELVGALREQRPLPSHAVVLTFDDCYRDNLEVVAPLLRRYSLPATFNLVTASLDRGENQWIDTLYSAFRNRSRTELRIDEGAECRWDIRHPMAAREAYFTVSDRLMDAGLQERRELLAFVVDQLAPTQTPPRLVLTWDEARELIRSSDLFEVGSHTVNHLDLQTHTDRAREEIQGSMDRIAAEFGEAPHHFAFPYSRSNAESRAVCRRVGLASVLIDGYPDYVVRRGTDPLALPRILATRSLTKLRRWTSGAFPDLSRALFGRA